MGQVPMAAAQDRLFPALFGRMSSRGVPAFAIVFSAALATGLVLVQAAAHRDSRPSTASWSDSATMTAVIPYAFCALAGGLVAAHVAGGGPRPA